MASFRSIYLPLLCTAILPIGYFMMVSWCWLLHVLRLRCPLLHFARPRGPWCKISLFWLLLCRTVSPHIRGKPWKKFAKLLVVGQLGSVGCTGPEERGSYLGNTRRLESAAIAGGCIGESQLALGGDSLPPSALGLRALPNVPLRVGFALLATTNTNN